MLKYTLPAFILSASAAAAHSGHEEAVVQGDVHWLSQADHLTVAVLSAATVGLLLRRAVQVKRAKKLAS